MQCQRAPLRLTDQALVAVEIARRLAASAGSVPNAAHLVGGLAAEPDGAAGTLLAQPARGPHALVDRAVPPGLPTLDAVLAQATAADGLPLWTLDLLRAALSAGGPELDDVLESAGYDPAALRDLLDRSQWPAGAARAETRGLQPHGIGALTPAAELAVARARALRGTVQDLALALESAQEPGWPARDLLVALQMAREHGRERASADDVVAAAGDPPVDCAGLARAAVRTLLGERR